MNKIGIYPGTFDPITNGHIDVIKRSLKIVNKLIIAASNDHSNEYLFSAEERVLIIKNSLFRDLKFKQQRIKVLSFNTLTTSLCSKYNATIIPRAKTALKIEIIIRDFGKKNELRVIISKVVSKNKPITPLVISKVIIPAPSEKANLAELGNNATLNEAKIIKIIPVNSLLLL